MEEDFQEEKPKKSIWREVILIIFLVLFCYLVSFRIITLINAWRLNAWLFEWLIGQLTQGKWWIFSQYFFLHPLEDPTDLAAGITYLFLYAPMLLSVIFALIIGTSLSYKKRGSPLSFYPIVFLLISVVVFIFWRWFLCASTDWCADAEKNVMNIIYGGIIFYLSFVFLYLIISFFFHSKRKTLLFKILIIIFLFLIVGAGVAGKVLSSRYTPEREKFEEDLNSLKQTAIQDKNPQKCEDIVQYYEDHVDKLVGPEGELERAYKTNYYYCIVEIAKSSDNVLLCEKLKKIKTGHIHITSDSIKSCSGEVDPSGKIGTCLNSGGSITTSICCKNTNDFSNTCVTGGCSCTSENSHQVKTCDCGNDKCFDEYKCVSREVYETQADFHLSEVISDNLPKSIEGYVCKSDCYGSNQYSCPTGYHRTECDYIELGSHGCCRLCSVFRVKCVKE